MQMVFPYRIARGRRGLFGLLALAFFVFIGQQFSLTHEIAHLGAEATQHASMLENSGGGYGDAERSETTEICADCLLVAGMVATPTKIRLQNFFPRPDPRFESPSPDIVVANHTGTPYRSRAPPPVPGQPS